MSEIKIARFVGMEACKSIFSGKSTFVLRSPEHYRRLYETSGGEDSKGDQDEALARTLNGGTAEFTRFVASCWTKLDKDEPTENEWNIFKKNDRNVVAIISTPSKVCRFLDNKLETNREGSSRRFPFYPVDHKEVIYGIQEDVDYTNITDIPPFAKGKKFINEKEYRFVLKYGAPLLIDSFIFCGGIDYMEKCFANPGITREQKNILRLIIMTAMAGYGDCTGKTMNEIIANSEVLFE